MIKYDNRGMQISQAVFSKVYVILQAQNIDFRLRALYYMGQNWDILLLGIQHLPSEEGKFIGMYHYGNKYFALLQKDMHSLLQTLHCEFPFYHHHIHPWVDSCSMLSQVEGVEAGSTIYQSSIDGWKSDRSQFLTQNIRSTILGCSG